MRLGAIICIIVSSGLIGLLVLSVFSAGCLDSPGAPNENGNDLSNSGLTSWSDDPNFVPVETAYNQTLSTFWSFTIDGPYASDGNWTSAALDPVPAIIYDVNGRPLYYEFYVRNNPGIPGYFWTASNKILGFPVFRIYEGAPARNFSVGISEAEAIVKSLYPGCPILSEKPVIYHDPNTGTMFTILNTTSGAEEKIIIDADTHEIVPDHPVENDRHRAYAVSYLDLITESEYASRISQWETEDTKASRVVDYIRAQGIDVRLPLSEGNASIIRNYYAVTYPDSVSPEPEPTPAILPITDELIENNVVPVETARDHALVVLWRRVIDRPDIFDSRSWRNTSLSQKDPVIIEDFSGRKLYYVFAVERNGTAVSDIIVGADKGLYSHPWGLETSNSGYDFVNATQKAREIAAQDFPGYTLHSIRPVYSLADNCCHNVTVMMEVENPKTHGIERILINTYSLESKTGTVISGNETDRYPSLFSDIMPQDFADSIVRWEKENAQVRNLTGFAAQSGIRRDQPLSNQEIVKMGTYLFDENKLPGPHLFDPVYPAPGPRPTLSKSVALWHRQADWNSGIYVDKAMSDTEISWLIRGYVPFGHHLSIYSNQGLSGMYSYFLTVPDAEYNRTFSVLKEDGGIFNAEIEENMDFVQISKRKNGMIYLPVGVFYPVEANVLRLEGKGVSLAPMKMVTINYDSLPVPDETEREKILAELNADDRVLFAFKEYVF